jgi:acetyl-CoA carboxylase biotin carboxylase subunit
MIKSVLVANRGEIALRVMRTCREMGIRTVAVFSEADRESLHVSMADAAVCVGPAPAKDSYLNMGNVVSAAVLSGCDAVHPGFGFLSENAEFAKAVRAAGLRFIGPKPEVIELLGDKINAKKAAVDAGLPVIPGSSGSVEDAAAARLHADAMGYPVIIKAAAGGGGKGMRIVRSAEELESQLSMAKVEAEKAFSDGTLYVEKYLEEPRHVEVQLIGDSKGNVVALGERDCTVQYKHQKLLEESPSGVVSPETRARMMDDGRRLFKKLGYEGAGTIEFLYKDGSYYFMEVNARIQVEHPVSELVSGVDIVKQQLLVASGEALPFSQEDVRLSGYALECRVNALSPGRLSLFVPPGGFGVRCDTYLYTGAYVPPFYDSMVAKIIVHADTREEGIARMLRALGETRIEGISTNIERQKKLLSHRGFRAGAYGTGFYEKVEKELAL